ncbi:GNAT family N-acetyltransferase [Pontibacter sp. E15-1]|uniref:GNAT family N-acetyltransferase n=1 Tax=Pontibacter sp. E15-1 TaxID=2919918 RepID=UPI001F4F750B|nr:GNAT family N-acetyltransferase [Pontibacter sp. E15-1]MCJ8165403.1 GNAT family N-acetyltransferase [Pontibacter sp. E15-1]
MPILYLKQPDIDRAQWDALVAQSPQRQVYSLSWYLDVVSPGWEAVVELDAAGQYTAVMPVPWKKKLGMRYIQQPLFCQQLGIYSQDTSVTAATCQAFVQELYLRFRYINGYNFNTGNHLAIPPLPNVWVAQHSTLYLHLHKAYRQLNHAYSTNQKRNLQRAQKAGLTLEESSDIEPVIRFFKEEAASRIYGGVAEEAYAQLRALHQALQERGFASLFYTLDRDGRRNSGALFTVWGGHIVYLFNAAPQHGRKQNGRTFILDHMIRTYAGQEMVLDFESPGEQESAIVRFYKSFGPETMPIPTMRYNQLPGSVRFLQGVRMRLVRKLKGRQGA